MYIFNRILPPLITGHHNSSSTDNIDAESTFSGNLSPTPSTTSSAIHRTLTRVRSRGDYDYEDHLAIEEEDEEDNEHRHIDYDDEELYYVTTPTEKKRPQLPLVAQEQRELKEARRRRELEREAEEYHRHRRDLEKKVLQVTVEEVAEDRDNWIPASPTLQRRVTSPPAAARTPDPYAWAFRGQNAQSRNSVRSNTNGHSPPDTSPKHALYYEVPPSPEPQPPKLVRANTLAYEEQLLASQRADDEAILAEKLAQITRRREQEGRDLPNRYLVRANTLPITTVEHDRHRLSYEEEVLAHRRAEEEEFIADRLAVLARRRASQAVEEARELASTPIDLGRYEQAESPVQQQRSPPRREYTEEAQLLERSPPRQRRVSYEDEGVPLVQRSPPRQRRISYGEEQQQHQQVQAQRSPPRQRRTSYEEKLAQSHQSPRREVVSPYEADEGVSLRQSPPRRRISYEEEAAKLQRSFQEDRERERVPSPPRRRISYHEEEEEVQERVASPPAPRRISYEEEVANLQRSYQEDISSIQRTYEEDIAQKQRQYQQELAAQQYQEQHNVSNNHQQSVNNTQREYQETIAFRQKEYEDAIRRRIARQQSFDNAKGVYDVENFDHKFDPNTPSSPVTSRANAQSQYTMSAPPVRYVDASQLSREDLEKRPPMPPRRSNTTPSSSGSGSSRRGHFSPPPPAYEDEREREDNLIKAAILASQQKDAYDQILDRQKLELEEAELLVALEESRRLQKEDEEFYTVLAASAAAAKAEASQKSSSEENYGYPTKRNSSYGESSSSNRNSLGSGYPEASSSNTSNRSSREYTGYSAVSGSYSYGMPPKPDQGSFVAQYQPAGRLSQHPASKGAQGNTPQSNKVSDEYYSGIINSGRRGSAAVEGSGSGSKDESPAQKRFREMLQMQAAEAASVANNSAGYEGGSLSRHYD